MSLRSALYSGARTLGTIESLRSPSAAAKRVVRRKVLSRSSGLVRRWLG